MTPSLAIVAFAADRPLSPRGERAREIASAAQHTADPQLIGPEGRVPVRRQSRRLSHVASPLLLDAWEPEAWSALRRRRPRPDAGLLVGFPVSGVYWGARWLVRQGVRYVVDLGDPWALTQPGGGPPPMGRLRAAECERFVWRHAAAAILTTELQAARLRALYPRLPITVRPNGYRPVGSAAAAERDRDDSGTLRLVHYGNIYEPRLPIAPLLSALAASGRWDSIVLTQQGDDWTGALRHPPRGVHVEHARACSWKDVVAAGPRHDLAIVLGNRNPAQLPSKAVQYLTLPIPRLAIAGSDSADALRGYVADKPGWLTLPWDAPPHLAGAAVAGHVGRVWSRPELAAPPAESWEVVARTLVDFTLAHTAGPRREPSVDQPDVRARAVASTSQPR